MKLHLGTLRRVRTVVDRMKKLSLKLEVKGSSAGELRLSTDTDKGSFATYFKDLMVDCSAGKLFPINVLFCVDLFKETVKSLAFDLL
jgi:Hus1-like protein